MYGLVAVPQPSQHSFSRYATFAHLANIDTSTLPEGPAPIDSINMWPYLTGAVTESPRQEVIYDHRRQRCGPADCCCSDRAFSPLPCSPP